MRFIKVKVKDYIVLHGYDNNDKEIEEFVSIPEAIEKLIAIDRIMFVTDKYILTSFTAGRLIYWHYEGSLIELENKLLEADKPIFP
jgi:hypothetical protein